MRSKMKVMMMLLVILGMACSVLPAWAQEEAVVDAVRVVVKT
jgi:hypothetical protein